MIDKIKYYGKYLVEIYVLFYLILFTGVNSLIAQKEIIEVNIIVIGMLSVMWLAFLLVNGREFPNQETIPYKQTFYIFILVYISSVVHSVNLTYSMNELFLWSITAFIFFGIYALIRWRVRVKHEIMTSLLVIGIVYNFLKLDQVINNWNDYISRDCGFRGMISPNKTAGMTSFVLVLSLSLLIASYHRQREFNGNKREGRVRILPYIGFITSWIVLFLTGSRGGYVAGIAGVAVVLLVDLFYTRKTRTINVPVVCIIIIYLIAFPIVGTIVNRPVQCPGTIGNITSRVDIWEYSIEKSIENPLLGIGPGTFQFVAFPEFGNYGQTVHPHSIYIKVLTERGILGVIASAFFLLTLLKIIIEDVNHVAYKLAGLGVLVVFMVQGLVDVVLYEPYLMRYMFALLAVVVSAGRKPVLVTSTEVMYHAEYD